MYNRKEIEARLKNGQMNRRLAAVYGCGEELVQDYAERYIHVLEGLTRQFPDNTSECAGLYTAPGRTEIGGNHTDHQLGCVLAGSVNLDAIAAAVPNGKNTICFYSEGYPLITIQLDNLMPQEDEKGTTVALIRGIAAKMMEMGYPVAGFDAYCTSTVMGGSGLSSSAAFETLIGVIINDLFCDGHFSAVDIAKMGQYTENVYFGKPSGLMDQMASSVGGIVAIDFKDKANPVVEKLDFDFASSGYVLCIIDSKSDHLELTHEYAKIPEEMGKVAGFFHKKYLREVNRGDLLKNAADIRKIAGDRAFLRALHFMDDNLRAQAEARMLRQKNIDEFLRLVSESGRSSYMYLQDTARSGAVEKQEMNVALALCDAFLNGKGAFRVHGGGFAGTVQAFVPKEDLGGFKASIEAVLGQGSCHVLTIRPVGGAAL